MRKLLCFCISFSMILGCIVPAFSFEPPRMTIEELKALFGHPDLIIIDVRQSESWKESDSKIKGAVREEPGDLKAWVNKYPKEKTIVLY